MRATNWWKWAALVAIGAWVWFWLWGPSSPETIRLKACVAVANAGMGAVKARYASSLIDTCEVTFNSRNGDLAVVVEEKTWADNDGNNHAIYRFSGIVRGKRVHDLKRMR